MPTTWKQHEKSLSEPGLCELLPIRDYLDDVMIRMSGEFVAGYVLKGAVSYFADDAGLNTIKSHLEAILRTIPEESMRLQFRFEVTEDLGDLLQRYQDCSRTQDEATLAMDQNRLAMWQRKEAGGEYLRRMTHLYLIWDSERHHRVLAVSGKTAKRNKDGGGFSLSTRKIVQRTLKEHSDLMSEFESLLNGIESAMVAAGLDPQRMSDQDLFLETKRALAPLKPDPLPLRQYPYSERYVTPREQCSVVSILGQTEDYINIDGLLWSFITLKAPPDATYPGILRSLLDLRPSRRGQHAGHDPEPVEGPGTLQETPQEDDGRAAGLQRKYPHRRDGAGRRSRAAEDPAGHHCQLIESREGEPHDWGANFEGSPHHG